MRRQPAAVTAPRPERELWLLTLEPRGEAAPARQVARAVKALGRGYGVKVVNLAKIPAKAG